MSNKMRQGLLFLFFLLATACQPSYDKEAVAKQLMDETLQQRIDNYKSVRRERCWEGLLREANRLADSILFVEAKMAKDTITRPPIPVRPKAPEKKILKDSTPVKPFLPDTIIQ
jgi:hypothetical protein